MLRNSTPTAPRLAALFCLVVLCFYFSDASAADVRYEFADEILRRIETAVAPWSALFRMAAYRLFWALVAADMAWTGLQWILKSRDLEDLVVTFVKKVMVILFFWFLLYFSDRLIPAIIDSFTTLPALVDAGVSGLTPDGIVLIGAKAFNQIYMNVGDLKLSDKIAVAIPVFLTAIAIFLCFLYIAVQFLIVKVESYIAIAGGLIMLGFGGAGITREFVNKYLQYAVSVGLRLMFMMLVVVMGRTISASMLVGSISKANLLADSVYCLGIAVVFVFLTANVNKIVAGLMSGAPQTGAADAVAAAITTVAAVATGAAATARGAEAGSGAAKKVSDALGAGYSAARAEGMAAPAAAVKAAASALGAGIGTFAGNVGASVMGRGSSGSGGSKKSGAGDNGGTPGAAGSVSADSPNLRPPAAAANAEPSGSGSSSAPSPSSETTAVPSTKTDKAESPPAGASAERQGVASKTEPPKAAVAKPAAGASSTSSSNASDSTSSPVASALRSGQAQTRQAQQDQAAQPSAAPAASTPADNVPVGADTGEAARSAVAEGGAAEAQIQAEAMAEAAREAVTPPSADAPQPSPGESRTASEPENFISGVERDREAPSGTARSNEGGHQSKPGSRPPAKDADSKNRDPKEDKPRGSVMDPGRAVQELHGFVLDDRAPGGGISFDLTKE